MGKQLVQGKEIDVGGTKLTIEKLVANKKHLKALNINVDALEAFTQNSIQASVNPAAQDDTALAKARTAINRGVSRAQEGGILTQIGDFSLWRC